MVAVRKGNVKLQRAQHCRSAFFQAYVDCSSIGYSAIDRPASIVST